MIGLYEYKGKDRRGTGVVGVTSEVPAVFIEKRFRRGWRQMTMTHRTLGHEVGAIGIDRDGLTGRRGWWGEGDSPGSDGGDDATS